MREGKREGVKLGGKAGKENTNSDVKIGNMDWCLKNCSFIACELLRQTERQRVRGHTKSISSRDSEIR